MSYELPRAPVAELWPDKGQWQRVKMADGTITARVACPRCGYFGLLDHEISAGGVVTPSVVCPAADCELHMGNVVLVGWLG